jgi:hypothetical protein
MQHMMHGRQSVLFTEHLLFFCFVCEEFCTLIARTSIWLPLMLDFSYECLELFTKNKIKKRGAQWIELIASYGGSHALKLTKEDVILYSANALLLPVYCLTLILIIKPLRSIETPKGKYFIYVSCHACSVLRTIPISCAHHVMSSSSAVYFR